MATQERPTLDPETARAIIDPQSYSDWDPLLDTFDRLREEGNYRVFAAQRRQERVSGVGAGAV